MTALICVTEACVTTPREVSSVSAQKAYGLMQTLKDAKVGPEAYALLHSAWEPAQIWRFQWEQWSI